MPSHTPIPFFVGRGIYAFHLTLAIAIKCGLYFCMSWAQNINSHRTDLSSLTILRLGEPEMNYPVTVLSRKAAAWVAFTFCVTCILGLPPQQPLGEAQLLCSVLNSVGASLKCPRNYHSLCPCSLARKCPSQPQFWKSLALSAFILVCIFYKDPSSCPASLTFACFLSIQVLSLSSNW